MKKSERTFLKTIRTSLKPKDHTPHSKRSTFKLCHVDDHLAWLVGCKSLCKLKVMWGNVKALGFGAKSNGLK